MTASPISDDEKARRQLLRELIIANPGAPRGVLDMRAQEAGLGAVPKWLWQTLRAELRAEGVKMPPVPRGQAAVNALLAAGGGSKRRRRRRTVAGGKAVDVPVKRRAAPSLSVDEREGQWIAQALQMGLPRAAELLERAQAEYVRFMQSITGRR